jgi:hypothetical protein
MRLFDEWHLEIYVSTDLTSEVAERLAGDVEAAVRQVADDLTARFRVAHQLRDLEFRASQ